MRVRFAVLCFALVASLVLPICAGDWTQFRGPHGLGISDETGIPIKWSATENIAWKVDLPGPGASSPIVVGDRVYLTSYSGYGLEPDKGDPKNLKRHLLCFNRLTGKPLWEPKVFEPKLPEHSYSGEGSYHGYVPSTPASDGERLYVYFGKSGVFCFDLDGKELWQKSLGDNTNGWGSGGSPVLYGKLVIVNASIESGSLVALDKLTGTEVWKAPNIQSAWDTPVLVERPARNELIISTQGRLHSFNPDDGKPLWNADGVHRYICPSPVVHDDVVYAIGGGHTSLAVKLGGSGDVTATHTLWKKTKGSNVSSPVYHEGHLYWVGDSGVCCQNAATGETVYQERLKPESDRFWSSPVLAEGKLYFIAQNNRTYVVAAQPKFELLTHNTIEGDDSRTNASPAVSHGQLLLRTDKALYCIGKK